MLIFRNPFHSVFSKSAASRFFMEEDTGGGSATGGDTTSTSTLEGFEPSSDGADGDGKPITRSLGGEERVEGEVLPNFGALGKKGDATTPAKPKTATETPKATEKVAGSPPDGSATPKKLPVEAPKTTEKAPDATKTPEKPAETQKPAAQTPKVEEKKPDAKAEEGKLPEIPKDDSDLDALKPKPGVPTHVVKSFDDMRARMKAERATARQAVEAAKRVQAEIETLKAANTGELPKEVAEELEGLRNFNQLFRAEQDPRFKAQFEAPITKAVENVYGFLNKHGLNEAVITEIKAYADKAKGDIEAWPRWNELVEAFTNPVDKQELLGALKSRRDAIAAKDHRLTEIAGSREKFMDKEEQTKFAQGVEQASIPLAAANDWIFEKDVPENATPEQKAAIDAYNVKAKAWLEKFSEYSRSAFHREPAVVAEMAVNAVKADYLAQENETLTKERDRALARATELEQRIAKIKNAGRMGSTEAPSVSAKPAAKTTTEEGKVGGDGQSAIRDFFAKR
jgi:FtsZ-binding cell division protein ZapB